MDNKTLRVGLLALILISLAALLLHETVDDQVLRIDGQSGHAIEILNDQTNGGSSVSRLKREGSRLVLECDIKPGYEWPYCEMAITLRKPPEGMDLTRYHSIYLWAKTTGPEPRQQLRVFLRNFDPAYAKAGDQGTMKPNEIVFDPNTEAQPIVVNLKQFNVASWWATANPQPVKYIGPQLENIAVISFTTGGNVVPGPHKIVLDGMELHGQLISAATLRLGIIVMWLSAIGGFLVVSWVQARRALHLSQRRQDSLRHANAELTARSRQYADRAYRDPLTGIPNRDGLKQALSKLVSGRTTPDGHGQFPLAIVFTDIDHFKSINDTHGHDVGDHVIKQFAQLLTDNVQRRDLVARWGGEEFLLMFPGTRCAEALIATERLRSCLHQQAWPTGGPVTASFGIAQVNSPEEIEDGIMCADRAMYNAKRSGRDRVIVYETPSSTDAMPL